MKDEGHLHHPGQGELVVQLPEDCSANDQGEVVEHSQGDQTEPLEKGSAVIGGDNWSLANQVPEQECIAPPCSGRPCQCPRSAPTSHARSTGSGQTGNLLIVATSSLRQVGLHAKTSQGATCTHFYIYLSYLYVYCSQFSIYTTFLFVIFNCQIF